MVSTKKLKFYHTAKNAGTTIENLGGTEQQWGTYDTVYLQTCDPPECNDPERCFIYHYPLWSFNKNPYPLQEYDVFSVVRNPYSKIISTFNYMFNKDKTTRFLYKRLDHFVRPNSFWLNMYVFTLLFVAMSNDIEYVYSIQPQCKLFTKDGKEYVNIILKYENLETEFNDLMKKYNKDVRIDSKRQNASVQHVSENDFTWVSIKVINYLFQEDFEKYGYEMK